MPDPFSPYVVSSDPFAAFAASPASSVQPVSASEPDTYWAGFRKGAGEGMVGGAKGFAEGVLSSPASFVAGLYHLATTRPDTSVRELLQAISSVPQAFREAGVDPEAWGRGVGDLTGQTMVGLSAGPITSRAVSGVRTAAASPLAARVGPKLVKHAATATGAYLGGPAGAIVGSGVGEELAAAMRPKTPPASLNPDLANSRKTTSNRFRLMLPASSLKPRGVITGSMDSLTSNPASMSKRSANLPMFL